MKENERKASIQDQIISRQNCTWIEVNLEFESSNLKSDDGNNFLHRKRYFLFTSEKEAYVFSQYRK